MPGAQMQRLLVGTILVHSLVATPIGLRAVPQVIGALAGMLLLAGLWTPAAGVVAACAEAWIAVWSPVHPGLVSGPSTPAFTAENTSHLLSFNSAEWSYRGVLITPKVVGPT